ncbi:PAS domain-containing protein [Sediminibacterium sp.]|uniref:PAS domain-containing protein n=1 Tax=Sediminibacterium sp. TaxID=1917865 RepID=UPI0027333169|nr:PAS domain-containing protein [Sediminibacterium sp.]MDP3394526.1 PAS domain-containing protein [Sediminibacterium sp.]MDP3568361.1 PAS domain-containing protein [Sediminibacterium sp.]
MFNSSPYSSKYQTLLAVGQLGGWEYDVLSKELWCSKFYFEILGRATADTPEWAKNSIKEVWENWLHPDDLENAKEYFADFILHPSLEYAQQFRMLHSNGEWITILDRAIAMLDDSGELTGFIIGTHLDITKERAVIEKSLIVQEMLSKAEGIAEVGSFEVLLPQRKATWSDQMLRIVEVCPNNINRQKNLLTHLVCEEDKAIFNEWAERAISTVGESTPIQVKIKTFKNNIKHVIVSGVTYKNNQGKIVKFIGVIKDNTYKIATMESLRLQNQKLRDIAWSQSHLVRGPLSTILGITKIINDCLVEDSDKLDLIKHLHDTAEKLDQVIREIVMSTTTPDEMLSYSQDYPSLQKLK